MIFDVKYKAVNSKEAKDITAKLRRKHILYLIVDYLQDEGLFKTADSLIVEGYLYDDYKVCDNIDLDLILQEYCNYYHMKYNKQPSICKKNLNTTNELMKLTTSSDNRKIRKSHHDYKSQLNSDTKSDDKLTDSMIINKIGDDDTNNDIHTMKPISKFLSNISIEFRGLVEQIYSEARIVSEAITWDDVKGLEQAKEYLKEASIYPAIYPDLFNGIVSPWKGILLHGPPGGGKTLLAKALSHESKRLFFNITPSTILSKWRGDSEKNVKILFDLARYYAPSIIFIDEIESLASRRDCATEHEASHRMKCELLVELDGLNRKSDNILFLASSNLPWEIDLAILRRMEKRVHIPLPDHKTRIDIFKGIINKITNDVNHIDFKSLAESTADYSGSDINVICKEATMMSIRRLIKVKQMKDGKQVHRITQQDLEASITKTKSTVKGRTKMYVDWSNGIGAE